MNREILKHPVAKVGLITGLFLGAAACRGTESNKASVPQDARILAEVSTFTSDGKKALYVCFERDDGDRFSITVEPGQTVEQSLHEEISTPKEKVSDDFVSAVLQMNGITDVDTTFPENAELMIPQECKYIER